MFTVSLPQTYSEGECSVLKILAVKTIKTTSPYERETINFYERERASK
jgi:hypothetical protein